MREAQPLRRAHVQVREYDAAAVEELPPRPAPGEPQLPEIHPGDVACVGPLLLLGMYRLFGPGLFPLLVKSHPLVLLAVRASVPALVAAGALVHSGQMALWLALLVPIPYLFFADPFYYWAGRRYGDRLTNYMIEQDPRWQGRIAKGERVMTRWGFLAIVVCCHPLVPVPVSVLFFIAGDSRMPIPLFALSSLLGTFISVASLLTLGYLLGNSAQAVVDTISYYGGYLSAATFAFIFISFFFSMRRSWRIVREREAQRQEKNR